MPHALVEEQRSLDFSGLYYGGLLRPGEKHSWHWDDGVRVTFTTEAQPDGSWDVRYVHRADPDGLAHHVRIVFVPLHYGGTRPLVVCPTCEGRRGVLYLEPERRRFRCRACLGLTYRSTRMDATARRKQRLERLAERYGIPAHRLENPTRPKGMREATFRRVLAELVALDAAVNPYRGTVRGLRSQLRALGVGV